MARKLVRATGFNLQRQHAVHHIDGDNRNNRLDNLLVFASNADHHRHHRWVKVAPLWDGRVYLSLQQVAS